MTGLDADYFDQWYKDMQGSARQAEIVRQALGLPAELESTSLLSWDGIATVLEFLDLRPGQVLLDLACGRGGYGLEMARRSGAALIGVDFSAVAVARARQVAGGSGLADRARFVTGDLAATGLDAASVDAVLCVDAVQFAEPPRAAVDECRRVLKPGGRVALTCWQAAAPGDERVPARLRGVDLDRDLSEAGFERVQVTDMTGWRHAERAMWEAAMAEDIGDDPALASMQQEAARTLPILDLVRRVLATATAPPT